MDALFSPNALLISPVDWGIPTERDDFLRRLWGYLDVIDVLSSASIFWSDELGAALFTNSKPPWLTDKSWGNPIVQAIYPMIRRHWTNVSPVGTQCSCSTSPARSCTSCSPDVNAAFLELVHELAMRSQTSVILGSEMDAPGNTNAVRFTCVSHAVNVVQLLYRDRSDYSKGLKLSSLCWPTQPDDRNYERLKIGVQLTAEVEFMWPASTRLPVFQASRRFLDDLARQTAYRDKILKALALRLMIGRAGATTHPTLRDEDPQYTDSGRRGERRFRATKKSRFHYLPLENDTMRLVRFFGPGEHDNGLR